MKTVQVQIRIPTARDLAHGIEEFTNEEITRFVCEFEELDSIKEFFTKTDSTEVYEERLQIQETRCTNKKSSDPCKEYYSDKTKTVYVISSHQGILFFRTIRFSDEPNHSYVIGINISYGLDADTAIAYACCKECGCTLTTAEDLDYRVVDFCNDPLCKFRNRTHGFDIPEKAKGKQSR